MERNAANRILVWDGLIQAVTDLGLLVKFKLTLLVLFSAVMSYAIVSDGKVDWGTMALLAFGGFMVTGAANALNQVLERDYDKLMTRTANRPVATGRMSVSTAVLWAGLLAMGGITVLSFLHPIAGFLGMLSLISYAFVYTPLKRTTPLSVVVGAIPGALPLVIGCVVQEGTISPVAMMLFSLQFLWQFPHFWAVAWLADEDYKKAGFYLLPSKNGQKDAATGYLSFIFCLLMIGNAVLAWVLGYVGIWATGILVALNAYWAWLCWRLYKDCSREAARKQMFMSFLHLPVSLIVLLIDKL
ncbi:MAG: protoheme IX farnesyltransferase [Haliscomenobacteraceae bacterium CHB4]|nr:Protoheme IX farnesyltransferase [Saprospiraceae bacterium]MCE7924983.1 protoheme IX farnesyltransferase [Haliscomenobacteraceae bacterium CHB4]